MTGVQTCALPICLLTGIGTMLELDFFFAERYSFCTGLILDNTGGRLSYPDTIELKVPGEPASVPAGSEVKFRLQYLGIPVGLKLKTQEIGYTTFFINLGVTPMVNLRSRISSEGIIPDRSDGKDETRLFNMNYFILAGIEYSLGGSTSLIGGIGFNSGFTDITSRAEDKVFTRSFSLKAGLLF